MRKEINVEELNDKIKEFLDNFFETPATETFVDYFEIGVFNTVEKFFLGDNGVFHPEKYIDMLDTLEKLNHPVFKYNRIMTELSNQGKFIKAMYGDKND